jgi:hypothetical protein
MSLRNWIASFPFPAPATTATTATEGSDGAELSQQSQLSQPSGDSCARSDNDAGDGRNALEESGDLRPCLLCRNLSPGGRCLAAWRGELRAARDWGPTFPGQPKRCIAYDPTADDPDQRHGRQRWPDLADWQSPLIH